MMRARTHLARRVRGYRQRRGWSRADLSRRARVSVSWLREIERGTGNPTLRTLVCVAHAFGLRVEHLLEPVNVYGVHPRCRVSGEPSSPGPRQPPTE